MTESPMCVIGIGAQKAGTTTVARELKRHPDFAFSAIKELHYFDGKYFPKHDFYLSKRFARRLKEISARPRPDEAGNPQAYRNLMHRLETLRLRVDLGEGKLSYTERFAREFDLSGVRCFGEITPAYALVPKIGFEEMRDMYPNTKLLFIMRDPFGRALSHARHEVTRGRFSKEEITPDFFLRDAVINRSQYAETIERLSGVFDPKDVFYGFFEDLIGDMPGFFRGLYGFLGLEYRAPDFSRHENASEKIDFDVPERELFDRLRPTYDFVSRNWPDTMPDRWRGTMEKFA
ncbi:sulfotransferase [Sedimentitalea sp. JM2-8]|uniref:Sulfotransferase n=1 Tax=Sedimentitalea xiamensis TaxID=3050037 RepID=A0ABT7FHK7_9RHOB|nr:sulfotransferase [Sedimentitalea xiamensis]MDK3074535.1 sulfotransferase [Sedimentitalea xiamensis]